MREHLSYSKTVFLLRTRFWNIQVLQNKQFIKNKVHLKMGPYFFVFIFNPTPWWSIFASIFISETLSVLEVRRSKVTVTPTPRIKMVIAKLIISILNSSTPS